MKNQYITSRPSGWAVVGQGNSRATKVLDTQAEAAAYGRRALQNGDGGELVIMDRSGKIRQKDTINHSDNFPPKG